MKFQIENAPRDRSTAIFREVDQNKIREEKKAVLFVGYSGVSKLRTSLMQRGEDGKWAMLGINIAIGEYKFFDKKESGWGCQERTVSLFKLLKNQTFSDYLKYARKLMIRIFGLDAEDFFVQIFLEDEIIGAQVGNFEVVSYHQPSLSDYKKVDLFDKKA